jgi:hypothetical protein
MLILIVIGTLFIFLNSLIQFIGSFQGLNSTISLNPYYAPGIIIYREILEISEQHNILFK